MIPFISDPSVIGRKAREALGGPLETARALQDLVNESALLGNRIGETVDALLKHFTCSRGWLTDHLKLLGLHQNVRDMIPKRHLPIGGRHTIKNSGQKELGYCFAQMLYRLPVEEQTAAAIEITKSRRYRSVMDVRTYVDKLLDKRKGRGFEIKPEAGYDSKTVATMDQELDTVPADEPRRFEWLVEQLGNYFGLNKNFTDLSHADIAKVIDKLAPVQRRIFLPYLSRLGIKLHEAAAATANAALKSA